MQAAVHAHNLNFHSKAQFLSDCPYYVKTTHLVLNWISLMDDAML